MKFFRGIPAKLLRKKNKTCLGFEVCEIFLSVPGKLLSARTYLLDFTGGALINLHIVEHTNGKYLKNSLLIFPFLFGFISFGLFVVDICRVSSGIRKENWERLADPVDLENIYMTCVMDCFIFQHIPLEQKRRFPSTSLRMSLMCLTYVRLA